MQRPPLNPRRSSTVPPNFTVTPESLRRTIPLPSDRQSRPNSTVSGSSLQVNPLQAEIERLTAACEEHERKIRATKSSIEHRLYNEIPHLLAKLNGVDDQAEWLRIQYQLTASQVLTTEIQEAHHSARGPLSTKLLTLTTARSKDVQTMRARTTPWRGFFEDSEDGSELGSGKIARIPGAGIGGEDSDGLARIERWVEDVNIYLNSEIIRLKLALSSKSRRQNLRSGSAVLSVVITIVLVLIAIGVAASRK